jgi:hypothetical protein
MPIYKVWESYGIHPSFEFSKYAAYDIVWHLVNQGLFAVGAGLRACPGQLLAYRSLL